MIFRKCDILKLVPTLGKLYIAGMCNKKQKIPPFTMSEGSGMEIVDQNGL